MNLPNLVKTTCLLLAASFGTCQAQAGNFTWNNLTDSIWEETTSWTLNDGTDEGADGIPSSNDNILAINGNGNITVNGTYSAARRAAPLPPMWWPRATRR
ncbi:MAG: hypothetical protein HC841_07695 [Verrucomicrobiae bacterium]|nr:hypothetical protein [Verrucomicrobiae bacterium]